MAEAIPFSKSTDRDLVDAVCDVLHASPEPLTVARIRERLPANFRSLRTEEITELLQRQVAAHVVVMCPKYRSSQDRYWDRPLRTHAKVLLHEAMRDEPVSWAELRKKFPKYVRHLAESVLSEELARGTVFRHPPVSQRSGPRYALQPVEIRTYAGKMLDEALERLEQIGFARSDARETLMQLLQEEEWATFEGMPARTDQWNTPLF
jgi:hypothetical protein